MDFVDLWYYLKILGDSLSPMLFLVTMEVYSRMVKRMEGARLLRGFRADGRRGRGECVSHLLFEDDTDRKSVV